VTDQPLNRLESWKDIAAYLKRDVSTVQRWEKREGMPVHRHVHDKLGSVYAFQAELDAWARSRRTTDAPPAKPRKLSLLLWVSAAVAIVLIGTIYWILKPTPAVRSSQNPLSAGRFARITDFEGIEQAAAISRDGRFAAFVADRDGPADVWVTQIGTGQFHNLTNGKLGELINPDIRTIGFSPDGASVAIWVRKPGAATPDISIWTVPTLGGEPKLYLEGVAEFDWSPDGSRMVYHTPAPGDPLFVKQEGVPERKIFHAAPGIHNHYLIWSPSGSEIYFVSGAVPNELDIWRIKADGGKPERLTSHKSRVSHPTFLDRGTLLYLASDADGGGPWLYALDVDRRETRRISFGVERYTSLAGSADGRRLVVTVASSRRTLWRVPIGKGVSDESAASRVTVPIVGGRSPRTASDVLLYVSSSTDSESIWKLASGRATELWSVKGGRILGGPAIVPDGRRIAFSVEVGGRARMYLINVDGSGLRAMPESLQPRGAPAWAPDGQSLVVAATIDGAPRLVKVATENATVTPIGADFAADPVFSPDGKTIIYSGPEVGTTFPLRTIGADGSSRRSPSITLSRGSRRLAFLSREKMLIVSRGDMIHKNFWAIDLDTGRERQLTNFGPNVVIGDFDVSPGGREIVFDREHDNSDIVLIDRERR
jgi:Tol biopolymer transport system component